MDAIDRHILTILQEDASLSIADVAARVGLSQTPCWKRIQRLEASGVLLRRVALLSPEKLGLGLSVYVSIVAGEHSDAWLERFTQSVAEMPQVVEFYRMAGDVDYMLRVVVSDMVAFDEFYKRLISIAPLRNVVSRFAMERIKATTALPIEPPAVGEAPRARRVAEAAAG
ncbi:MAG: transcriptional regulator [Methylocystaceae bacterium]|nr:MAG: transcriptional regulator [Methylocystaceae bacterium]